jgi:AcrR family transcriptional regulator
MTGNEETKAKIEKAALDEFMEKGFANASLRQIVKNAGLTTGAFYKYFPTKEDLFASLVEPYANKIYSIYDVTLQNFQTLSSSEQQNAMTRVSTDSITQMLNYIYEHYDNFKLLLCKADGTEFTSFIHKTQSTLKFIEDMRKSGTEIPQLDKDFIHMVSSGMFSAMFEIVVHDMKKSVAIERVKKLKMFYTGGWEKLFGISF